MKLRPWLGFLAVLLIIAVPIFAHMEELSIQKWDEGRVVESALEMKMKGDYLLTQYNGHTDFYSTKPPLLNWLQILCMAIFGLSEFALRLPSALAALGNCMLIYWILGMRLKQPWLGFISCAVLITSTGYVSGHAIRTGDYDALLSFFTFAHVVFYFVYLEDNKRRYLLLSFVALTLAVFTKSVAAMLFLPALFAYTLYRKRLPVVLKEKWFYICGIGLCVLVFTFYCLGEKHTPGYLMAVWTSELGGRFNVVQENHGGGWLYYIDIMKTTFFPWIWLVIPGICSIALIKELPLKRFAVLTAIAGVFFILIISKAQTKLAWYPMPAYAFLSILCGLLIWRGFNLVTNIPLRYNPFPYLFLAFVFFRPYKEIVYSVTHRPQPDWWAVGVDDMAQFMSSVLHNRINIDNSTVLKCDTAQQNLFFYAKALQYAGKPIKFMNADTFSAPGKYVVYTPETKTYIENNFEYTIREKYNSVFIYNITGKKTTVDSLQTAKPN